MAEQIVFFEKNKADYEQDFVTTTASQGDDTADRVLNRNNIDAWVTEGSVDADNTTLEIDMVDVREINSILLLGHNFKSFNIKYWDGDSYEDFSPAISKTTETADGNLFEFTTVFTTKVKLTILGTQTVNDDKILRQFIITRKIGQLEGWPVMNNPKLDRNLKINPMLSGKKHVVENQDSYSVSLQVKNWKNDDDLELIETLYEMNEGFLFWPCGGSESQFSTVRKGYRFEDIFLVRPVSPHSPEYYQGMYQTGMQIKLDLTEVIT